MWWPYLGRKKAGCKQEMSSSARRAWYGGGAASQSDQNPAKTARADGDEAPEEVVRGIEESLKGREGDTGRHLEDTNENGAPRDENEEMVDAPALDKANEVLEPTKNGRESLRVTPRMTGPTAATSNAKVNGVPKVDKRVIEQRIEEDRERNKRLRESMWAVGGDDGEELAKMWEEGSDVGEDDHVLADEEIEERRQHARYSHADVPVEART